MVWTLRPSPDPTRSPPPSSAEFCSKVVIRKFLDIPHPPHFVSHSNPTSHCSHFTPTATTVMSLLHSFALKCVIEPLACSHLSPPGSAPVAPRQQGSPSLVNSDGSSSMIDLTTGTTLSYATLTARSAIGLHGTDDMDTHRHIWAH